MIEMIIYSQFNDEKDKYDIFVWNKEIKWLVQTLHQIYQKLLWSYNRCSALSKELSASIIT